MNTEQGTSPDATGFSNRERTHDPVLSRLDVLEGKLDDIVYALEQIQERLLDLNTDSPGYSVTD